jgi:nucleoid DNA-binding protein
MKQVRVNIATLVNASKIREEIRDGRKVVIVPSTTLVDGGILNKIRYPASVIADSFHTLEGTPAPLGHPVLNGKFVSAKDPQGLVRTFIGAWNENVRRENGRVHVDKVIDVAFANQSDGGKRVLAAVEKQKPIHTSTGLLATLKPLTNSDDGAEWEVETMVLDHDAVLLDEPGAATPEQGVGMFVNAAGEEMEVINSVLSDDIERDEMWALESILRAEERKLRAPLLERIKAAIEAVIRGGPVPEDVVNQEATDVDKEQFEALSAKVDALTAAPALTKDEVAEIVANALKPITDAAEASAAAAKTELVNKVVEAKLLDQATAEAADTAVLSVLANSIVQTPVAFRVNGAFKPSSKTDRMALAPKGE